MRYEEYVSSLRPSLIGSLSVNGVTAVGNPVDTMGFASVLAILFGNAVVGSNPGLLNIKIQESADPAGTNWVDITNGAVSAGSYTLSLAFTSGTDPRISCDFQSENLNDSNRLRYIRAHATNAGTSGLGVRFAIALELRRPHDTLYLGSATVYPTFNGEFIPSKTI